MGSCHRSVRRAGGLVLALVLLALAPASAQAHHGSRQSAAADQTSFAPPAPGQHGPLFGHLPPVEQNLDVVGKLEPTAAQGPLVEGQIADLAVHKGFAYLNSWDEESCTKGGTYVVDISDPANPDEVDFLPAADGYYHGEGAHVVTLDTPQFKGDLLAVNDEPCSNDLTRPAEVAADAGGFDLYDVTDPRNPQLLVQNAGDFTADGVTEPADEEYANSYHSVFVWQDGPRAFLVGVDNTELADIDIFDITDPANPEFIADFDPLFEFPEELANQIVGEAALGEEIFHHDMVVKRVGGQMRMIASYWDAGYLQLDVTNPAEPQYVTDTNFDDPDSLTGMDPPEGNAHESEYSHDNEFILAADEDFASHRLDEFSITSGPDAGVYDSSVVPGSAPVSGLEDGVLNGPTTFGGYGCNASAAIPTRASIDPALDPGEEAIIVLQRGPSVGDDPGAGTDEGCFPGEKAQNAEDAGWDAVLLTNRHLGTPDDDGADCGSGGFTSPTVAICTTHEAQHLLFGQVPGFGIPYPANHNPTLGQEGEEVEATVLFDGWGYAHLYDAETSVELDAFAIPEALDERYSGGFGDLSIHEFATDPTENLAYSSYYSGGIRVLRFSRANGLEQTGAWIDQGGSNFWGIEQYTTPEGERLIAGSDRDFGLVILRYTGPDAPAPPSCEGSGSFTPSGTPVRLPLTCTDPNGNPLERLIAGGPEHGTLGEVDGDSVLYTPEDGFQGFDGVSYTASDGAATSAPAFAEVAVGPASNRFGLRLGKFKNGRIVVIVNVQAPGRVSAGLRGALPRAARATIARSVRLARTTKIAKKRGSVRLVVKLGAAKRRQLRKALARSRSGRLRGTLTVSYKPIGGTARKTRRKLTIGQGG